MCLRALLSLLSTAMDVAFSTQQRLQTASDEYQKFQMELSTAVETRQRLDAQLSENELVRKVRS